VRGKSGTAGLKPSTPKCCFLAPVLSEGKRRWGLGGRQGQGEKSYYCGAGIEKGDQDILRSSREGTLIREE